MCARSAVALLRRLVLPSGAILRVVLFHPLLAGPRRRGVLDKWHVLVERIMRANGVHEALGMTPDATVADMRRMYRKTCLLVHPDKCQVRRGLTSDLMRVLCMRAA